MGRAAATPSYWVPAAHRPVLWLPAWDAPPWTSQDPLEGGSRQTRKIERYPPGTDRQLVAMAFPCGDTSRHAKERASNLEAIGYAKVHEGRKIMPGTSWAGWNGGD